MSDFDTPRDEQGRFLADHYRTEHERLEFTPLEERPRDEDSARYIRPLREANGGPNACSNSQAPRPPACERNSYIRSERGR